MGRDGMESPGVLPTSLVSVIIFTQYADNQLEVLPMLSLVRPADVRRNFILFLLLSLQREISDPFS